jgi:hypothetical protein
MVSGAQGADFPERTRVQTMRTVPVARTVEAVRPIARLANQGLGYSVAHGPSAIAPLPYRVHVTCTIDESFAQTYCPTAAYYSSCPRARIACQ